MNSKELNYKIDVKIMNQNNLQEYPIKIRITLDGNKKPLNISSKIRCIHDGQVGVYYYDINNQSITGIQFRLEYHDTDYYAYIHGSGINKRILLSKMDHKTIIYQGSSEHKIIENNKNRRKHQRIKKEELQAGVIRLTNVKTKHDAKAVKMFDARWNSRYDYWYITEYHNKEKFAKWL